MPFPIQGIKDSHTKQWWYLGNMMLAPISTLEGGVASIMSSCFSSPSSRSQAPISRSGRMGHLLPDWSHQPSLYETNALTTSLLRCPQLTELAIQLLKIPPTPPPHTLTNIPVLVQEKKKDPFKEVCNDTPEIYTMRLCYTENMTL